MAELTSHEELASGPACVFKRLRKCEVGLVEPPLRELHPSEEAASGRRRRVLNAGLRMISLEPGIPIDDLQGSFLGFNEIILDPGDSAQSSLRARSK